MKMTENQKRHYLDNCGKLYDHRMAFADFMVDYLDTIPVHNFSTKRVYAAYDTFQAWLCQGELPDEKEVIVKERGKPVVKMVKRGEKVLIHFKAGKEWAEVRCPLEMIKFTDWWLYT